MQNRNSFDADPFDDFGYRISYARKKANDFKWAKDMANYYDRFYSPSFYNEERRKLKINYDLFNGRNPSLQEYKSYFSQYNYGEDAKYNDLIANFDQIEHHPIIDQIAKAMVGERRRRKINAKVKDLSLTAKNQRKAKKVELIKQLFDNVIINPIREQVLKSMNVEGQELTEEQQQQIQAQQEEKVQSMLLEEISAYMENDYYLPTDIQGQRMLKHWMMINDIENVTVEGFKHALISGKEVYRHGIRNNKPFAELTNPLGLSYYLSPNKSNIEDSEWIRYEQSINLKEFFDMFGSVLESKHLKLLDKIVEGGVTGGTHNSRIESNLVSVVSNDPRVRRGEIDQRNKKGQEYLRNIYGSFQGSSKVILNHVHLAFVAQRMMYYVYRRNEETGRLGYEWLDESYTPNKMAGDISWKTLWVNQIWQLDKIGFGDDAIYLNIGPIEGQYNSPEDPFNPKMPYIGSEYSRLMGNAKNVAIMDLGKPWQYKFNVQMARIQEMEATDLGNVMLLTQQAIPKDWDPIDFYGYLKHYKLGILDLQQEGVGPRDADVIKGIDLSNPAKQQQALAYLEFLKDNIAKSMYYNPSRLGQISPYLPVTNNQQNILQSSTQTEDIYSIHNSVTERLLNAMVDDARLAYYMDPSAYDYILDDASLGDLEVSPDVLKNARLGVTVSNQSEDDINMQAIKEFIPFLLQTDKINFEEVVKLLWATSGSEILNIAKKGDRKSLDREKAAAENEQRMMQMQQEQEQRMFKMQAELEQIKQSSQNDVDQDQINDKVNREMEKIKYDRDNDEKERVLKLRLKEIDERIAEKQIDSQERVNKYKNNKLGRS